MQWEVVSTCKLSVATEISEGWDCPLQRLYKIILGTLGHMVVATFRYYEKIKVKFIMIIKECGSCAAEIDQSKIKQ